MQVQVTSAQRKLKTCIDAWPLRGAVTKNNMEGQKEVFFTCRNDPKRSTLISPVLIWIIQTIPNLLSTQGELRRATAAVAAAKAF